MATPHVVVTTTVELVDSYGQRQRFNTRYSRTLSSLVVADFSVGADATKDLWDPTRDATEVSSDFDFLYALSDGDLDMELETDTGAEVGREQGSVRLVKGLPLMLGADDSYANHSVGDAFGGTLDVIDRLRADEPSSATRSLKLIMGT